MSTNVFECIKSSINKRIKKSNSEFRNRKIEILNQDNISCSQYTSNNSNSNSKNNNNKNAKSLSNWISTTKYSILTFIPKNLFEQFCRVANLYFLFILILTQIPAITPVAGAPSAINLCIVLLINAVKEGYEDFRRHQSDKKINFQKSIVIENGEEVKKYWRDLKVGDVVKTENEQQFPADMVLLSSSSELSEGQCYIETSNLDGETNLKSKQSLLETNTYLRTVQDFFPFHSVLEYEVPSQNLNKFDGRITMTTRSPNENGAINTAETYPLNNEQLLIRGTTLMNTKWIYGIVVYTGHETKYMLNTMATPSKRSKLERTMNRILLYVLVAEICLCLASAFLGLAYETRLGIDSFYLQLDRKFGIRTLERFFTFVVLYSTIIPISLYVTMELVRVLQIIFINKDKRMYYKETDQYATARTSNLNEELGQVEYIFSDKTGTLTRNEMEFRMCCISGQVYGSLPCEKNFQVGSDHVLNISQENLKGHFKKNSYDHSIESLLNHSIQSKPFSIDFSIKENYEFFLVLAICNTVIPESCNSSNGIEEIPCNYNEIKYSSSSPDEIALVKAASTMGFNYHSRTPSTIGINVNGDEKVFSILNVLEFTSDRKRMSIIVKEMNSNEIILYCKGADSSILPFISKNFLDNNQEIIKESEDSLKKFSCNGLRTLCLSKKVISKEDYDSWNILYKEASVSIVNREQNLQNISAQIENDWDLMGITGIEDKLQENVTSTISTLLSANIKIFMLTGDKQETAINIGLSCQLLSGCEILILNDNNINSIQTSMENSIQKINNVNNVNNNVNNNDIDNIQLQNISSSSSQSVPTQNQNFALIIDGMTLSLILGNGTEDLFYELIKLCKSVVCCRVTPFQKSEVVRIFKERTNSITLAIGDGANDVSMIQKAHIGIGISGKEGRQAVLASDFAISQFRFLERLVLVHGRYNYKRLCLLICFFFFKNLMSCLLQLWHSTNTQFSGQTFYDAANILGYNLIFTSLPIIVIGVLEVDIDPEYIKRFPQLYRECQLGKSFNHKIFWSWIVLGVYCSACIYFFTSHIYIEGATDSSARVGGQWLTSAAGFTSLVFVVSLRLAMTVQSWTIYHHITIWGSLLVYALLETIYSLIYINYTSYFHLVFITLVNQPIFFIALILTIITALLPPYTIQYISRNYYPEMFHIAQEIQRFDKDEKRKKLKKTFVNNKSII